MKKTLSILIGLALAVSVFGQSDEALSELTMTMSTQGPDYYADDAPVAVGETYLLVYVKAGQTFQGVRSDESLVNTNNLKATTSQAIAGSKCEFKAIQYAEKDYPAGGTWVLVLLDTRKANGAPGGLITGYSDSEVIPAAKKAAAGGANLGGDLKVQADDGKGLSVGSVASAPANTPDPVIAAVDPKGEKVDVRIKNFTDAASYEVQTRTSLAAGNWEPAVGGKLLQAKTLGVTPGPAAELPVTLDVPANDTVRFFRVIVPGGK